MATLLNKYQKWFEELPYTELYTAAKGVNSIEYEERKEGGNIEIVATSKLPELQNKNYQNANIFNRPKKNDLEYQTNGYSNDWFKSTLKYLYEKKQATLLENFIGAAFSTYRVGEFYLLFSKEQTGFNLHLKINDVEYKLEKTTISNVKSRLKGSGFDVFELPNGAFPDLEKAPTLRVSIPKESNDIFFDLEELESNDIEVIEVAFSISFDFDFADEKFDHTQPNIVVGDDTGIMSIHYIIDKEQGEENKLRIGVLKYWMTIDYSQDTTKDATKFFMTYRLYYLDDILKYREKPRSAFRKSKEELRGTGVICAPPFLIKSESWKRERPYYSGEDMADYLFYAMGESVPIGNPLWGYAFNSQTSYSKETQTASVTVYHQTNQGRTTTGNIEIKNFHFNATGSIHNEQQSSVYWIRQIRGGDFSVTPDDTKNNYDNRNVHRYLDVYWHNKYEEKEKTTLKDRSGQKLAEIDWWIGTGRANENNGMYVSDYIHANSPFSADKITAIIDVEYPNSLCYVEVSKDRTYLDFLELREQEREDLIAYIDKQTNAREQFKTLKENILSLDKKDEKYDEKVESFIDAFEKSFYKILYNNFCGWDVIKQLNGGQTYFILKRTEEEEEEDGERETN